MQEREFSSEREGEKEGEPRWMRWWEGSRVGRGGGGSGERRRERGVEYEGGGWKPGGRGGGGALGVLKVGMLRLAVSQGYMGKFNETYKLLRMELVFFHDALEHLCRITRLFGLSRGSALLVGVGGSGKQSLTRLAAFIANSTCFQVATHAFMMKYELPLSLICVYSTFHHLIPWHLLPSGHSFVHDEIMRSHFHHQIIMRYFDHTCINWSLYLML